MKTIVGKKSHILLEVIEKFIFRSYETHLRSYFRDEFISCQNF